MATPKRSPTHPRMAGIIPGASINGDRTARLPNTSSFSFGGIDSNAALLLLLDRHDVCCSAGSACRTGSAEASHVLRAMYLNEDRARGSLRFSFGRFNSDSDVDRAIEIVPKVVEKLRRSSLPSPPNAQLVIESLI
jgi:cysteine desulfurase